MTFSVCIGRNPAIRIPNGKRPRRSPFCPTVRGTVRPVQETPRAEVFLAQRPFTAQGRESTRIFGQSRDCSPRNRQISRSCRANKECPRKRTREDTRRRMPSGRTAGASRCAEPSAAKPRTTYPALSLPCGHKRKSDEETTGSVPAKKDQSR